MQSALRSAAAIAAFAYFGIHSVAAAAPIEVLWLGHATTRITSASGKVIIIDPFLRQNPKTPAKYRELKALGKVDLILVTHGHADHIRDLKELAILTNAKVVANYDFVLNLISLGVLDSDQMIGMNKGGTVSPLGRGIKVHMVPAEHSSTMDLSVTGKNIAGLEGLRAIYGGPSVGYVVELETGFKIYHSGDTDVFPGMVLIQEFYRPDLALICIGGHFTMGPKGAAYALSRLIKPKQVIPIHYGTFPVINRTPDELIEALGDSSIEVLKLAPGQTAKF